jgi:DNA-directed RNA polymerase subunit RPC12/RpoP
MQIKVYTSTAGDKSWVRVVDQHSGVSREVECPACDAKYFAKVLKKWVKKQVKELKE